MHIKTMTYHFSPIKMVKIKIISTAGEGVHIFIYCLNVFSYVAK